jgi:hypothetical protein
MALASLVRVLTIPADAIDYELARATAQRPFIETENVAAADT